MATTSLQFGFTLGPVAGPGGGSVASAAGADIHTRRATMTTDMASLISANGGDATTQANAVNVDWTALQATFKDVTIFIDTGSGISVSRLKAIFASVVSQLAGSGMTP